MIAESGGIGVSRHGGAVGSPGSGSSLLRLLAFCMMLYWNGPAIAQVATPPATSKTASGSPAEASEKESASSAKSKFRITGIVINSTTGSAVAGVELNVAEMSARQGAGRGAGRSSGQSLYAVSDQSGRFEIEVPSAGGWSITASAHGYHTQALDEHEGYSTAVVLTEATPTFDLVFRLPPASVIEGYVVDEAGDPVRNGQVTLSVIPPATPEADHPRHQVRGTQRTDDRGYYKFSGLMAANYEIRLQAQPWYASSGVGQRYGGGGISAAAGGISEDGTVSNGSTAPDPLDVVYPVVWYPGVTDFSAAAPLALHAGEVREADFRLSPIPGFHLRMPANSQNNDNRRTPLQGGGYLSQILSDGSEAPVVTSTQMDSQGNTEFSGLAPGTYQLHRQGDAGNGAASTIVQISSNSARTLDVSQEITTATVTIKIDPAADVPSLQVSFRDMDNGRTISLQSSRFLGRQGVRRRGSGADESVGSGRAVGSDQPVERPAARSISLPPGRYEVSLGGINDLHLTSIEATGASAVGRTVTIGGGTPSLMLHVAAGRTNLTGFVRLQGSPDAGSMVLLVPATLGDPAGLGVVRRDQSNSDGSFDILNILPGQYILIAVDRGWEVNWRDPATLRRFLVHGLPLDLSVPGDSKATVEAQAP